MYRFSGQPLSDAQKSMLTSCSWFYVAMDELPGLAVSARRRWSVVYSRPGYVAGAGRSRGNSDRGNNYNQIAW